MIIKYEDFAKLEIRIGTILTVEVVPEADKLLKLMVDVGEESPRQIISGIREFFPAEQELVGRQCPFLINLETRKIRGFESQGMVLAVGDESAFTLLHPGSVIPPGTSIR
jgi:methionine--tRNA ligase beta chain